MNKKVWFWGYTIINKGGPTSGNYGHKGRPGIKGGSMPGGGHGAIGVGLGSGVDTLDFIKNYRQQKQPKAKKQIAPTLTGEAPDYANIDVDAIDPDMEEWFNEATGEENWAIAESHEVKQLVQYKAAELSKKTGIDVVTTAKLGKAWATTSNDHDMRSLAIQSAVVAEFGIAPSQWQWEKITETLTKKEGTVKTPITSQEETQKYLRAMYDQTQARFAERGYRPDDLITIFRGIAQDLGAKGESVDLEQNAISSWTIAGFVANAFAGEHNVLAMDVPVSSILSTALTGFGCLDEGEVVVFGVPGSQATII